MAGNVVSNIEELAEAIGSYVGMLEGVSQRAYMNRLITKAAKRVSPVFDKFAVSSALGDSSLAHMWEYGTIGMGGRQGQQRLNPLSQTSKLWRTTIVGGGGQKTISFALLPAKVMVPPHNLEEIGVKQEDMPPLKVETGLRMYKFPNKAAIYESGAPVTIAPRLSKALFIPLKTEGTPAGAYGDASKGFVWTKKAHTYSPGLMSDSKGRFTGLFGSWWATTGSALIEAEMSKEVEKDLFEITTGIRPSRKLTSAEAINIKAATERGRRKTRKQWTLKVNHDDTSGTEIIL